MAAITLDRPVDVVTVPAWAWLALLLALIGLWLVSFEDGQVVHLFGQANALLHETFHDGRHLLGVPCH
jgi:hypothetical protein